MSDSQRPLKTPLIMEKEKEQKKTKNEFGSPTGTPLWFPNCEESRPTEAPGVTSVANAEMSDRWPIAITPSMPARLRNYAVLPLLSRSQRCAALCFSTQKAVGLILSGHPAETLQMLLS